MTKYVMILVLMMVSTLMFAQRKGSPAERAVKQADRMKRELALDDVQYKSVKAINEEYANKQFQVRSDSALARETRHEEMKTLHQEKEAAIKKVLTAEQQSKWTAQRKEQRKKHSAQMRKTRGDHAFRMQKALSLNDDQTSKIKEIDQEFAAKFRALRNDSTLAKEDAKRKTKQLWEEHRAKTKSILTEEQFKKWEVKKAERRKKRG